MPTIHPKDENPYVIDTEEGAELARLVYQDQILTQNTGGLFENVDVANIHDVLDIACGPGGWALDVAYRYPEMNVTGIDVSPKMVEYSQARALVQWRKNASFAVMNALKSLDFADNSFDFVNARLLIGFMVQEAWPRLVQECKRVLRPGGILRLTECDVPLTTSVTSDWLYGKMAEAFERSGRIASSNRQSGITVMLGHLLRQAGFDSVQSTAYGLDFSADAELHSDIVKDLSIMFRLLQPFAVKMGVVATEQEFEQTYQQIMLEMSQEDFCGLWYYRSVRGTKPS